ncbi:MAG: hypothetical protein AXA67_09035 [Methylothermaceae bacteria B42]|nr:MAG: hypothetical protein AXA67_09035 [Methylothermaceae bacteria B42]HHJ39448.1 hypothetical protein [Methylothermaceae bacterium]
MRKITRLLFTLFLSIVPPLAMAHGGGSGVEGTACRLKVGNYVVRFTAYQPQVTGDKEYCTRLPSLGPTNLVIDYESRALRGIEVEFEVTRESDGERLFYQPPEKLKTGNFNTVVDFKEPGKYDIHIKLKAGVEEVDEHIPLLVGVAEKVNTRIIIVATVLVLGALYIFYLSSAGFRRRVDSLFGKLAKF